MAMRKLFCFLFGLGVLFTACQTEDTANGVVTDNSGNVNIKISPQDLVGQTRAYNAGVSNSARGGITNVDMTKYDLRYKLAVYRVDGTSVTEVVAPQVKVLDAYQETSYSLRLTPNRTYKFVVWADFVSPGSTADLHYNTADLQNITCLDADAAQLNDESRDAYFITDEETVPAEGLSTTLILKRPFAKVRVVTTDWDTTFKNVMPDNFKVTYYGCDRFKGINAVTGKYTDKETLDATGHTYTGTIDKATKEYALGYDKSDNNRTLTVDYLMTDENTVQTPIHLNFQALSGTDVVSTYDFKQNVPIQRNYLTTLLGNMLTANTLITVKIDENFTDEYVDHEAWFEKQGFAPVEPSKVTENGITTYIIKTRYELMWVAEHPEMLNAATIVQLAADIDMNGVDWLPMGRSYAQGSSGSFDGQGHTLSNFSVNGKYQWHDGVKEKIIGVIGNWDGSIIKDLNFENITINGLDGAFGTEEYTYFAGPIARNNAHDIVNVHSKHVFIKGSGADGVQRQNIGGLIGYSANWRTIKNCSAVDVHLRGIQVGGLIGSLQSGSTLESCSTDYVYLRLGEPADTDKQIAAGGFVGDLIDGTNVTFKSCTAPTHVEYVNDADGTPNTTYKEANSLYGYCRGNSDKIVIQ
jgi:hypothetical protein